MSTPPVNSNSSQPAVTNKINDVSRELQSLKEVQVFKDDAGTRRVLMGRGANGFYGLKVSKEGFDVYDAALGDLVFNSDNNIFKIIDVVDIDYPETSGTQNTAGVENSVNQAIVAHGLSSTPAYVAFATSGGGTGGYTSLPNSFFSSNFSGTALMYGYIDVEIDETNIIVNNWSIIINTAASAASHVSSSGTVRIYLLQETAA